MGLVERCTSGSKFVYDFADKHLFRGEETK
jgi:hypothetical protein